jgi:NADPH:quinone reductase-like Zn-dependent oxidoreductase
VKAWVHDKFGPPDVLELREIDPPEVGGDGIVVRVQAASVNPADWHLLRGEPYFARLMAGRKPPEGRRIGTDLAGVVEAVGKDVTAFRAGDEVFGGRDGAFGELVRCTEASSIVSKPPGIRFEQAAAIPIAGLTALQALRDKAKLQPGQLLLVNGAAGGVGTFAVQIAKASGATVTGVCSTGNVDLVRSIGADDVVDYTQQDFTKLGVKYDVILDTVGNHSVSDLRRVLAPRGTAVLIGGGGGGKLLGPLVSLAIPLVVSPFVGQKLTSFLAKLTKDDLLAMKDLVEIGKVTPVIDKSYSLADVPDAIRYVETGHAKGKVVITI